MKHVILKPTNGISVLPISYVYPHQVSFRSLLPGSVRFRKKGKKEVWASAWSVTSGIKFVTMLWVEMAKKIIHSDISDRTMRLF